MTIAIIISTIIILLVLFVAQDPKHARHTNFLVCLNTGLLGLKPAENDFIFGEYFLS